MGKTIPNFKAKRKDNGQWVCGSYFALHHNDNRDHIHHFIIPNGAPIPKGTPIDKVQVEIDPDSLTLVDDSGEELLMVSRKRVQKYWAEIKKFEPTAEPFDRKAHYQGQLEALYDCFGDKCLPDMPEITDSGSGAQGTTPPSYKLDVKPKHVSTEEVCKMLGVEKDDSLVKPFRVGIRS